MRCDNDLPPEDLEEVRKFAAYLSRPLGDTPAERERIYKEAYGLHCGDDHAVEGGQHVD